MRTERKVSTMMLSIPPIAQIAFTRSLVLDEVVNTKAIEDIHRTRRQVKEALDSAAGDNIHLRRFKELARLCLELSKAEHEVPSTPDDMPEAISAIASHYVFEYAHPFYDGNGRTGRGLLSLFLSEALSAPTVLSLSRAITENRDVCYKALKTAEDPLNRGELTFFVYNLLKLVRLAQTGVIDSLERSKSSFEAMSGRMKDLAARFRLPEKEACLVFALSQFELFGMFGSASLDELAQSIDLGKQMTRKHISALENKGIVHKTGYRPAAFALTDEAKDALGIDGKQ